MTEVKNPEFSKWEAILAGEKLALVRGTVQGDLKRAGHDSCSAEELAEKTREMQKASDDAVEYENKYSSSIPLNKQGLPPCKKTVEQKTRNGEYISKDKEGGFQEY